MRHFINLVKIYCNHCSRCNEMKNYELIVNNLKQTKGTHSFAVKIFIVVKTNYQLLVKLSDEPNIELNIDNALKTVTAEDRKRIHKIVDNLLKKPEDNK